VGEALTINWVMAPPHGGSGGHTTAFRLITDLERRGHVCRIYIYDAFGSDASFFESIVREAFPSFQGEVGDALDGMADAHAVVATSWPTAYVIFNDECRGRRFYLVQDYEPWFYPVGGQSALAETTYRMGFHAITAGRFLSHKLRSEYGMAADGFDFGCDTDRYRLSDDRERTGVIFYARPAAARRAFELGVMALQLFTEAHPDVEIHFYGDRIGRLPFRFVDHGLITPDELNALYNRCFAGLSLSMTNVSLVPHEMLAAGCIPVVNDADHNRIVLDNPHVTYAEPTPHALAAALAEVVTRPNFDEVARKAAASIQAVSWDDAGELVEEVLVREVGR
jgi:glycosyltransferase involved in cell wall biosynthesis